MKIAVCVGGLIYSDSEKSVRILKERFPKYDFFFGTWSRCKNDYTDSIGCWYYEEPETPTYHPYLDVKPEEYVCESQLLHIRERMNSNRKMPNGRLKKIAEWEQKSLHQLKQIMMHSFMLDDISEDYDMIIRTRFDINISDMSIPFEKFIERSYKEEKTIGFASKWSNKNSDQYWSAKNKKHHWWHGFVMDLILMHPRKMFDSKLMWKLYEEKRLLPAEFGWYQILAEPYNDNHECYFTRIGITSRDGWRKIL